MCWLYPGFLSTLSQKILDSCLLDLVYLSLCFLIIHEISNPTMSPILDPWLWCSNVIMDLLYIIWLPKWSLYAWINSYWIYHQILLPIIFPPNKSKGNSNAVGSFSPGTCCFFKNHSWNAFNQPSFIWNTFRFLFSFNVLLIHVKIDP